jgi:predicted acyltransferase
LRTSSWRACGRGSTRLYASILPPYVASLAWAISMVVFFYLVALWMERRGLYLKV